ncbi:hypothetical protein SESBI_21696 [Sesbania bispinosa]|nr:hypothetical protein SESBI_21696 [Sesbania bispinosa]
MKKQDMDMQSYLSKLDSLIADFDSLMPFTDNVDEHAKQRGKFFMVLALAGLPHDLDSVRNQILSSPTIPSYDTVCEQLLRLSTPQSFAPSASASFPVSDDSTPILIIAVDEEVVEAIAPALGVTIAKGLVMLRSNAEPRQINSSLRF